MYFMDFLHVYILRGLPGSGKSTFIADKVKESGFIDYAICSADHHFLNGSGQYVFNPKELGVAHRKCQDKFLISLHPEESLEAIFVDNTNTTVRELEFYVKTCVAHGVPFSIVNVHCSPEKAAARNVHGVPYEKVCQMAARLEHACAHTPEEWPQIDHWSGHVEES